MAPPGLTCFIYRSLENYYLVDNFIVMCSTTNLQLMGNLIVVFLTRRFALESLSNR